MVLPSGLYMLNVTHFHVMLVDVEVYVKVDNPADEMLPCASSWPEPKVAQLVMVGAIAGQLTS